MSWDLFIQDLPSGTRTVDEIADSFEPAPLGDRAALNARIRQLEPNANFADLSWGEVAGDGYDIEHIRVPLERYDEESGTWGTWAEYFRWQEVNEMQLERFPLAGVIQSIGSTQPGANDDGQWYEPAAEPSVAADSGPE